METIRSPTDPYEDEDLEPCAFCGKPVNNGKKYCSRECYIADLR